MELDPKIADPEIIDTLEELRSRTPEKGTYGGRGWANYATTYFNDCLRFARGAHWCLRPGASALVVIGNSILQGVPIPRINSWPVSPKWQVSTLSTSTFRAASESGTASSTPRCGLERPAHETGYTKPWWN